MKLLSLILILSSSLVNAADLTVNLTNLRSDNGQVFVAIWDSSQGFPKDYNLAIDKVIAPASDPKVVIENLKPGKYAIAVFHDKNSDGDLNTNAIGIPKEAFGFSNNPRLLFGPPSFRKANFKVGTSNKSITIKFKYF